MQFRRTRRTHHARGGIAICGLAGPADAVNVGNNPGGPNAMLTVNSGPFGGSPSFLLVENVTHDPAAGNLLKDFTNTSQGGGGTGSPGIPSGVNVPIDETFLNTGTDTWIAWTERVVSTSPPIGPGFLFDDTTPITVRRNGLILTAGVDYTLSTTSFNQFGNSGYTEIAVNLAASSYIQPTDSIGIQKRIHEVSGDSNVWGINEAARITQYPTVPEPTALALLAASGVAALFRRRRRGGRPGRDS